MENPKKAPFGPVLPPPKRGPLRYLVGSFIRGLLFVVPVGATIWILITVFSWLDGLIRIPGDWKLELANGEVIPVARTGAGFLITVVGVILIGMLTSSVLTRWMVSRVEDLFTRVPVVKLIYSSIKDMVQAFLSEQKKFDKPVLLSFSEQPDVEVIGFVTRSDLSEFGRPGKVSVYVPQSYNFAANLILVPKERVTPIELPAGDVMAFVVSGGVSEATRNGDAAEG